MDTLELLFPVSILILAALWIGGVRSHRASILPSGYWPLGWCALLGVGIWEQLVPASTHDLPHHFLGAAFPFLMAAGAYQYADRTPPGWLVPAALVAGLMRASGEALGVTAFTGWLELLLNSGILLIGAKVASEARIVSASNRWLVVASLAALALMEVRDSFAVVSTEGGRPEIQWELWAGVGVGAAAIQLIATMDRLRLHARSYASELAERSEHLQAVLGSLGGTRVIVLDREGGVREILGGPPGAAESEIREQAYGRSGAKFIGAEGDRKARRIVDRVFETGEPDQLEVRLPIDGREFFFVVSLSGVRDDAGKITYVVGVVHDLTEREAAAEALRSSEERLRAILETLSFNPGIVTLNRAGEIVEVVGAPVDGPTDPRGLRAADTAGVSISTFLGGADLVSVEHAIDTVMSGGGNVDLQLEVELPAGERSFDVSFRPLHGAGGQVELVMGVCTDVTERVAAERERLAFEQRSLEAQKLESIGVLAGGIAHDFNNLLSGIVGNAELALDEVRDGDANVRTLLSDIHRAGERAAELTTQLLAYAGKARFSRSLMHLPTLVDEMASLLRSTLPAGVRLEFDFDEADAWVEGDATQMRQLVMNLITNAAEAQRGGEGSVAIGIHVRELDPQESFPILSGNRPLPFGSYVILSVRDTGVGMDEETQAHIFEPFFTTKFEGRGLGLAAALGVVRRHEGSLRVDSKLAQGTLFEILLPKADAAVEIEAAVAPNEPFARRSETILVIDDDDGVRRVAQRMLEREGYRVHAASSRVEAVELFETYRNEIDALLVDLTMPDCNGVELAAELRKRAGVELPILYMSGHSAEDSEASSSRVRPFVHKPFSRQALREAVNGLWDE